LVAASGLLAASTSGATQPAAKAKRPVWVDAYVTYYGWYDNTPPGCSTAYAGCVTGTGTYADPITFASDSKEFPVGTILYYPTVEKYFRMRDDCSECDADWEGKGPDGGPRLRHVDLWIGGKGGKEWDVIRCEDALTQNTTSGAPLQTPVIVNPPSTLPTSTSPLFNSHSNSCYGGARTQKFYGRYQNKRTGQCLGAGGGTPGAPMVAGPCSNSSSQRLTFDGAFFTVGKLCLATRGQHFGARLLFVSCSGRRHQLWEIGTGGVIATIQQVACITEVNGTVQLGSCRTKGSNQWTFVSDGRAASTVAQPTSPGGAATVAQPTSPVIADTGSQPTSTVVADTGSQPTSPVAAATGG
jgi:hypothetical protein